MHALAEQAAELVRVGFDIRKMVASSQAASLHAACRLGQVTHAANNDRVQTLGEDGKILIETSRDSKPRSYKRKVGLLPS